MNDFSMSMDRRVNDVAGFMYIHYLLEQRSVVLGVAHARFGTNGLVYRAAACLLKRPSCRRLACH